MIYVEQIIINADRQSNRVRDLVNENRIPVQDGELLLSKISVACVELAFIEIDEPQETDTNLAAQQTVSGLNRVLNICSAL